MIKSLGNTVWHCYSPVESLLCHGFHFITFGSNVLPTVKPRVASLSGVLRFSVDFKVLYVFATWDDYMVYGLGFHCYQLLFSCSLYRFEILGLLYLVVTRLCRTNLARVELIAGRIAWVLFSLRLEESRIFTGVFSRNASACFELRAFYIVHYISAMQNIGYFPLGKCSSSSALMSSILLSRLLSVLLLEVKGFPQHPFDALPAATKCDLEVHWSLIVSILALISHTAFVN